MMDLEKLDLRCDSVKEENALSHWSFERALGDRWVCAPSRVISHRAY